MPIIPSTKQMISLDVSGGGVNTGAANGVIGNAISGFGDKAEQAGYALLNKVKQAEAQDAVSNAENQDYLWSTTTIAKLNKENSDGYMHDPNGGYVIDQKTGTRRTVSQHYSEMADERYRANQETMPSAMAQQMYNERQSRWFTGQIASVFNDGQVRMVSAFKSNTDRQVQQDSDMFLSTPSIDQKAFYLRLDSLQGRLQSNVGTLYGKETADGYLKDYASTMANSNVQGSIDNIIERVRNKEVGFDMAGQVNKVWAQLDGTDDYSRTRREQGLMTTADSLKPAEQQHLRHQLLALKETSGRLHEENFNEAVQDLYGEAKVGPGRGKTRRSLQTLDSAIVGLGTPYVASGQVTPEQISRRRAILSANYIVGNYINTSSFAKKPEAAMRADEARANKDLDALLQNIVPKDSPFAVSIGGVAREVLHDQFKTEIEKINSKNRTDSAALMIEQDPHTLVPLRDSIDTSNPLELAGSKFGSLHAMTKRDVLSKNPGYGVERRYIDKDMVERFSATFKSPDVDAGVKADAIWKSARNNSSAYHDFMDQAIKDGHLGAEWQYVKNFPNQRLASEFVSTISSLNQKDDQNFKDYLSGVKGINEEQFKQIVYPQLQKWEAAVQAESPWDPNQASMQNAMRTFFYKKASVIMRGEGAGDAKKSGELAYKALVDNHTHVFTISRGGGFFENTPKTIVQMRLNKRLSNGFPVLEGDEEVIRQWNEKQLTEEGLSKINFLAPKNLAQQGLDRNRMVQAISANAVVTPDPKNSDFLNIKYRSQWDHSDVLLLSKDKYGIEHPIRIPVESILKNRKTPEEGAINKILKGLTFDHEAVDPY